jgi:hypothetical protein
MISHPKIKKQRLTDSSIEMIVVASAGDLSTELLANILGFLDGPKDIMQKRRVCKKWKEAVKITIVPLTDFRVGSVQKYNDMVVMVTEMPNLQQITLTTLGMGHKYADGEDTFDFSAFFPFNPPQETELDLEIISNFSKLRVLKIAMNAPLSGRYPFLFNSFPLLEKFTIDTCFHLKWDLEMLAGFPVLRELECINNFMVTGNISSMRVLKDTLERVRIGHGVEGNFMDLADFPHLKKVDLHSTAVTGDIRDIGENDFLSVEELSLPERVYGARGHKFRRISDAPAVVKAVYLLKKQRRALKLEDWYGELSEDSPDWYEQAANYPQDFYYPPPFRIRFVKAGSRIGYRWEAGYQNGCEVKWLDPEPEPERESSDYGQYIEELQSIESQVNMFRGCHQPPTEEEYRRLVEAAPPRDEYITFTEAEIDSIRESIARQLQNDTN